MSRRKRGDSAAFSLLEAVIATAVLTTMILSMAVALTDFFYDMRHFHIERALYHWRLHWRLPVA